MSEYRPSLTAAIQVGKKTLTGRHHRDIYAAMTPEERALAGTDGRQFGFVDEAGKYLHRAPAMQYAREMGLLHPKHADTKSPHLISEMLADRPARKKGGGLYANIHAKQERIKHGSGERMRKPGTGDAPSAQDFRDSARTARKDGGEVFHEPGSQEHDDNLGRFLRNSKVRDAEGQHKVLYHATRHDFDEFKPGGYDPRLSGPATWLSPYPDHTPAAHNGAGTGEGKNWATGSRVIPVHADIRSPLMLDNPQMLDWARQVFAKGSTSFPLLITPETRQALLDEGYDGIFHGGSRTRAGVRGSEHPHPESPYVLGDDPHKEEEIIALHPPGRNQIKSVLGRGTFDPNDPHMGRAGGGRAARADGGGFGNLDWGDDEPPSAHALANEAKRAQYAAPPPAPPLPHDPTSREKRATQLGYVHHGFHGTRADVGAFDPNLVDVGTHIGTDEQANQRLKHTRKWSDDHTGENVLPVRAKLGKSFRLPDVGSWNDSAEVMQHIAAHGRRMNPDWRPNHRTAVALHEAAINGRDSYQAAWAKGMKDWHETPQNRELLNGINRMLRDDGYGSIKYHNIAENAHGSTPGIRHDVQKRLEEMEREVNAIYAADNSADPVGAKSRINDLQARMNDLQYDPSSKNDRHSYIVLNPAHLRSRFAKFDPAKANEPDLLAAKGGFMRKPRADGGSVNEDEKLHTGPIHSPVAGRTDHLPMHVPSGSYVIPADIIGAMGEGNTMAGFKHVRRMFAGNPYGNKPAPYDQGAKTPYGTDPDTQPYDPSAGPYQSELPGKAAGGSANHVAIVAAGGEYVLTPDEVRMAGDGDLERGHRVLDEFIKRYRQKTIKTLQKLPGPARD